MNQFAQRPNDPVDAKAAREQAETTRVEQPQTEDTLDPTGIVAEGHKRITEREDRAQDRDPDRQDTQQFNTD